MYGPFEMAPELEGAESRREFDEPWETTRTSEPPTGNGLFAGLGGTMWHPPPEGALNGTF